MSEESENAIIYVENESIANKEIVKSNLTETVKDYVKRLLDKWNPDESDFIVLKVPQTISLDLPLNKELYKRVEKFGVKRVGNKAEVEIPTYEIIYSNRWMGEDMETDRFVVIMPYINDEAINQVVNNILASLTPEGEGEGEGEEFLEE
ncbi:DUF2286 domain-containing protein [Vulcanisaeta souniana]|uniref:DUF2286 domain-containing protein n=1 Tax=Vulcanisaeta souniana JCM 11219 TaxID=1293586 RepID=A0A830EAS6_9CREN|nr:DUF2286 domain-containing protein [Vulcanisaeta souniana]BDR91147.1 hypothetical protein Vsou_02400 [Vulcanisaeta souniana JCM 11219]GGI81183.1 hypothetical protein GCM10007112_17440 [Vulcanisaeta souniana JCM 11219]